MQQANWREETKWKPEYAIGDALIDGQHEQLFKLAGDLIEACEAGHNHVVLGEALDFLAFYTIKHFTDEEALQLRVGFPQYDEHKALHDDFKAVAAGLIAQYKQTPLSSAELSDTTQSVIVSWLKNHVINADSKIAKYIG